MLSVTVNGTVVAPAAARRTKKLVWVVFAGSVSVKLPVEPVWPPGMSIRPFEAAPKAIETSWLLDRLADVCAVTVTCRRPPLAGVALTPTAGRTEHGGGPQL